MRLFVAIDLDDAARRSVAAEQQRLRTAAEDASALRWVKPEHLHMTLVFFGEIDEMRADAVVTAYADPAGSPPFDLVLRGIGVFPPRGAPRALWIGVAEGEERLKDLHQELAARASQLGIALDARVFSPHLSLARWKASRPSDRGRMLAHATDETIARVRVERATLYRSHLSSAGPTYTPLAHATLTASQ